MSDVHLRLHSLEIVRLVGLNLSSHSLAGPLPETVKLAVHYDRSVKGMREKECVESLGLGILKK